MTQKANYFKLGLFVIIATGTGAAFLMIFGAADFLKKELLAETCFNESVQGLNIGSEVKYKGIKIGSVKSITSAARIYHTKSDYVLVVISLEEGISLGQTGDSTTTIIENAIRDGLSTRLAFKGITGVAYLETDYYPESNEPELTISWSPDNIYIPSRKSTMKHYGDALNQILDNLTAINLKGITTSIEHLLKTLDQKADNFDTKAISGQTAALLTELKGTTQKINATIESEKVQGFIADAQASFSDLRTIIETSKKPVNQAINDFQKSARSTKKITEGLEKRLSPRIDDLSSNLDRLMKNLADTSGLLENIVWLNSDRVKLIFENLETTSENLKQMSKEIKRYPARLLFEKPPEKSPGRKN